MRTRQKKLILLWDFYFLVFFRRSSTISELSCISLRGTFVCVLLDFLILSVFSLPPNGQNMDILGGFSRVEHHFILTCHVNVLLSWTTDGILLSSSLGSNMLQREFGLVFKSPENRLLRTTLGTTYTFLTTLIGPL